MSGASCLYVSSKNRAGKEALLFPVRLIIRSLLLATGGQLEGLQLIDFYY